MLASLLCHVALATLTTLEPATPPRPVGAICCGDLGQQVVARDIAILTTCPDWRQRDDAARRLRQHDWRCHPEAVDALATALLKDPEEEVREEAAESLAKMVPLDPRAFLAVKTAAERDPDWAVRFHAKLARKRIDRASRNFKRTVFFHKPKPLIPRVELPSRLDLEFRLGLPRLHKPRLIPFEVRPTPEVIVPQPEPRLDLEPRVLPVPPDRPDVEEIDPVPPRPAPSLEPPVLPDPLPRPSPRTESSGPDSPVLEGPGRNGDGDSVPTRPEPIPIPPRS